MTRDPWGDFLRRYDDYLDGLITYRDLEMGKSVTLRDEILMALSERRLQTASEVAMLTTGPLASVSSLLRKMVRKGVVLRVNGVGPRGGYGYVAAPSKDNGRSS